MRLNKLILILAIIIVALVMISVFSKKTPVNKLEGQPAFEAPQSGISPVPTAGELRAAAEKRKTETEAVKKLDERLKAERAARRQAIDIVSLQKPVAPPTHPVSTHPSKEEEEKMKAKGIIAY